MNQLAIDFTEYTRGATARSAPNLHRRRDPDTSHAAAERTNEFRARHIASIWAALKDHDMTCAEIARYTKLDYIAVARRMKEGDGKFWVRTGEKRPGKTDRLAAVWGAINV